MKPMLVTTKTLATRVMHVDLVYTIERMQVIANREGNPFGIAIKAFGGGDGVGRCSTAIVPLQPSRRTDCDRNGAAAGNSRLVC
jgi:hypothetical protein